MTRLPLACLLLPLLLTAQTATLPDISYDPKAPLNWKESLVKDFGYAKLFDISFDSPRGGRANGYAVVPARAAHPAGIVWQHWAQGNRASFIPEALNMARRGAASILINSPAMRPQPATQGFDQWTQTAVDLRRAADALVERYGVPATRLAYVGHSYGATLGGVMAVGERRFRALVLMGGFASISDAILHPLQGPPGTAEDAKIMAAIDAERYIGHAAPAALLFQFARYDRFISEEQAKRYVAAASDPKEVHWYDCGHEFNDAQSARDREDWLARQLSLMKK